MEKQANPTYLKSITITDPSDIHTIKEDVENDMILILRVTPLGEKSEEELRKIVEELYVSARDSGADIARLGEERVIVIPPSWGLYHPLQSPSKRLKKLVKGIHVRADFTVSMWINPDEDGAGLVHTIRKDMENGWMIILHVGDCYHSPESMEKLYEFMQEMWTIARDIGGDITRLGEERVVLTPPSIQLWKPPEATWSRRKRRKAKRERLDLPDGLSRKRDDTSKAPVVCEPSPLESILAEQSKII